MDQDLCPLTGSHQLTKTFQFWKYFCRSEQIPFMFRMFIIYTIIVQEWLLKWVDPISKKNPLIIFLSTNLNWEYLKLLDVLRINRISTAQWVFWHSRSVLRTQYNTPLGFNNRPSCWIISWKSEFCVVFF